MKNSLLLTESRTPFPKTIFWLPVEVTQSLSSEQELNLQKRRSRMETCSKVQRVGQDGHKFCFYVTLSFFTETSKVKNVFLNLLWRQIFLLDSFLSRWWSISIFLFIHSYYHHTCLTFSRRRILLLGFRSRNSSDRMFRLTVLDSGCGSGSKHKFISSRRHTVNSPWSITQTWSLLTQKASGNRTQSSFSVSAWICIFGA